MKDFLQHKGLWGADGLVAAAALLAAIYFFAFGGAMYALLSLSISGLSIRKAKVRVELEMYQEALQRLLDKGAS